MKDKEKTLLHMVDWSDSGGTEINPSPFKIPFSSVIITFFLHDERKSEVAFLLYFLVRLKKGVMLFEEFSTIFY
jgi:hypothetical protein